MARVTRPKRMSVALKPATRAVKTPARRPSRGAVVAPTPTRPRTKSCPSGQFYDRIEQQCVARESKVPSHRTEVTVSDELAPTRTTIPTPPPSSTPPHSTPGSSSAEPPFHGGGVISTLPAPTLVAPPPSFRSAPLEPLVVPEELPESRGSNLLLLLLAAAVAYAVTR